MRVLVCGGRNFDDCQYLSDTLDAAILYGVTRITEIIHGDARVADYFAGRWARKTGVKCRAFAADWKQYGKAAGPIRNQRIRLR